MRKITRLLFALALWGAVWPVFHPAIARADDASTDRKPVLWLIGDSTVRNGRGSGGDGLWGWGDLLAEQFDTNRIHLANRALGGRSSRTFRTEGLWKRVLDQLQPGDFVILQFGHNDGGSFTGPRGRASLKGNGEETRLVTHEDGREETIHSYGWYLRQYIADTRAKGAIPIVCSLVPRNLWSGSRVRRASQDYGKWAAEAAQQEGAFFIDLNERVARRYEELGPERVGRDYFLGDHTHTNFEGARLNALCVAEGIRELRGCGLSDFLKPAAPLADAAR